MIKGLRPQFSVLGHIKAGGRKKIRDRAVPEKWDSFIVTTAQRDDLNYEVDEPLMQRLLKAQLEVSVREATETLYDENQQVVGRKLLVPMDRLVQQNEKLRRITVFLPFDDPNENLLTTLAVYDGSGVRCRGDGEKAEWIDPTDGKVLKVKCPCQMLRIALENGRVEDRPSHPRLTPNVQRGEVCKAHGLLRVMVVEAQTMGGVHIFRTTSTNSIKQLMASQTHIQELTGGFLSYIPLELCIEPKKVRPESSRGYQTVYVVRLTCKAGPMEFLKEVAARSQLRAQLQSRIATREIASLPPPGHEDAEEQIAVAQEFMATDVDPDDIVGDAESFEAKKPQEPAQQSAQQSTQQQPKMTPPPQQPAQQSEKQSEKQPELKAEKPEVRPENREKQTEDLPKTVESLPKQAENPEQKAEKPEPSPDPVAEPSKSAPAETSSGGNGGSKGMPSLDSDGFPVIVNAEPPSPDRSLASKELRKQWIDAGRNAGFTDPQLRDWIHRLWNVESSAKLLTWQVSTMTTLLQQMKAGTS
jgi:outer membrane biosynthesis protein TonB